MAQRRYGKDESKESILPSSDSDGNMESLSEENQGSELSSCSGRERSSENYETSDENDDNREPPKKKQKSDQWRWDPACPHKEKPRKISFRDTPGMNRAIGRSVRGNVSAIDVVNIFLHEDFWENIVMKQIDVLIRN